jgi:4,5-DOPA dioxygenase extradiol
MNNRTSTDRRLILTRTAALAAISALDVATASLMAATGPAPTRMPVIFVGHGGPMNALRDNPFTRALRAWGTELGRPKAILSVSAHWLTPGETLVDAQMKPRTAC